MNHITTLTHAEAEGLKRALAQLINERDLDAEISLLKTSIEFARTDNGELRTMMFKSLFSVAQLNIVVSSIDRPQ